MSMRRVVDWRSFAVFLPTWMMDKRENRFSDPSRRITENLIDNLDAKGRQPITAIDFVTYSAALRCICRFGCHTTITARLVRGSSATGGTCPTDGGHFFCAMDAILVRSSSISPFGPSLPDSRQTKRSDSKPVHAILSIVGRTDGSCFRPWGPLFFTKLLCGHTGPSPPCCQEQSIRACYPFAAFEMSKEPE